MTTAPIPSITDEQIAEIEALASDACQYAGHDWFTAPDLSAWFADDDALFMAAASPFAVRAIISRLRAAERDAARYRWLRNHVCMGCPSPEGSQYKDAYLVVTGYGHDESNDLTDRAIDAAMSETKP